VRTDVAGFVGVAGSRHLHETVRVDDWRSYEQLYLSDDDHRALPVPPGSKLADTVRSFFANGGSRCYVVNVAVDVQASHKTLLQNDMLGVERDPMPVVDGQAVRTLGLESLLRQDEVSLVVLPDLFAELVETEVRVAPDEPLYEASRFSRCAPTRMPAGSQPSVTTGRRLFTKAEILALQQALVGRCARERWRAFALLALPPDLSPDQVLAQRALLGREDCAAVYWPWLLVQPTPGAPVEERAPLGAVAGIFARRDLQLGPHAAPANEVVTDTVGLAAPVDDELAGRLYDAGVNVLRPAPGQGIKLWGARTLAWSDDAWQRPATAYVNVRRCLSAIERSAESIGQREVFEPNTPILWLRLTQALTSYLLTVFRAGALAGDSADESFYVKCDDTVNPPESLERGELYVHIGVAIAAPAEFILFRLGRREGNVEIREGV
jgi:hypothetical protein